MSATQWAERPALVLLLAKLQELGARLTRLEALQQAQRAATVARAFKPGGAS